MTQNRRTNSSEWASHAHAGIHTASAPRLRLEKMTKDEFIDVYLSRSELTLYRTSDGFEIDGLRSVALPCACGEDSCEGWAMIPDNSWNIRNHLFFRGPDEGRPESPMGDDEAKDLKAAIAADSEKAQS